MKNRIKSLVAAVVITIGLLFAASPEVSASVPRPLNSYVKKQPQHTVIRIYIGTDKAIVMVYDGPGLVEVVIEGED